MLKSSEYDSVLKFRKLSAFNELTLEQRLDYAKKALVYSKRLKVDSIRIKSNALYATLCLHAGKLDEFKAVNTENYLLSKSVGDSVVLANAGHNLGWYYHQNRIHKDSAYYYYHDAYKISEQLGLIDRQIDLLINISELQNLEKDYIGSEESAVKAIKLVETLPKSDYNYESLWLLYNRIGDGAITLKLYDKAIEYQNKAYKMANKMSDGRLLELYSENNMAHAYIDKGDYEKALHLYERVFNQKDLFDVDPSFYSLVLQNVGFTRFLNGNKDFGTIERMLERAYHLSDSLSDPINKLYATIKFTEFYKSQEKHDLALAYAEESYLLAKENSFNDLLLESMVLLSELKPDPEGKAYLKEYIKLSDSLLTYERGIRNKFARIQFETDELELEKERIATEKMWWTIGFVVLLIAFVLIYIIITQDIKNKKLIFKQNQQETNEKIYNLLLSQQDKVDAARAEEKKRISEEMHDGILSRLFGTRLILDSYNMAEGEPARQARSKYIAELKEIESDIRKISHELNTDFVANSGFIDVLLELIDKQAEAYQLEYEFDHGEDIDWDLVCNRIKINIYRMVQEALQNIYKHAKAKTVKISFWSENSIICMAIEDDGIGFVLSKSKKKGIGLKNIYSRVKTLKGTVVFDSEIGQGTTITVNIPTTE